MQFSYSECAAFRVSENRVVGPADRYLVALLSVKQCDLTEGQIVQGSFCFQCDQFSALDLEFYHNTVI